MIRPASIRNWTWASASWTWASATWRWRDPAPSVGRVELTSQSTATPTAGARLTPASLVHWTWRDASWTWRTATWRWRDRDSQWLLPSVSIGVQADGGRAVGGSVTPAIALAGWGTAAQAFAAALSAQPISIGSALSDLAALAGSVQAGTAIHGVATISGAALLAGVETGLTLIAAVERPGASLGAALAGTIALDGQAYAGGIRTVNLPPTRKSLTTRRAAWQ